MYGKASYLLSKAIYKNTIAYNRCFHFLGMLSKNCKLFLSANKLKIKHSNTSLFFILETTSVCMGKIANSKTVSRGILESRLKNRVFKTFNKTNKPII